ncbi:MAG: hypothetical protein ACPGRW_06100 [Flavobacteriaceae bacterium]
MSEPQEIQEGLFVMKWRNFLPMMFGIIVGTNTFSVFYQKQQQNTLQIEYERDRVDRINKRNLQEAKDHYLLEQLKRDLEECQKSNK